MTPQTVKQINNKYENYLHVLFTLIQTEMTMSVGSQVPTKN